MYKIEDRIPIIHGNRANGENHIYVDTDKDVYYKDGDDHDNKVYLSREQVLKAACVILGIEFEDKDFPNE